MASGPPEQGSRRYHRIGPYQVLAHLATGGMGVVYKALDEAGREVALKILSPELAAKPVAVERFRREALQGAKLSHENIVRLYEFGEVNGTFFLALEYVDGVDLHEFVGRKGRLEPAEGLDFLTQACRALDCLHREGIVHRDIKPSNFLVTRAGERLVIKLTDLGVAREVAEEAARVTQAGHTVGTVDYMAPEQARDSGLADIRSDLYSLGCTFYHTLAGHPPFPEGGIAERVYKHIEAEPPDVRRFNPAVPLATVFVLRRMMAKKPENRYQTPAELQSDLDRLGRGEPPAALPSWDDETAVRASAPSPEPPTLPGSGPAFLPGLTAPAAEATRGPSGDTPLPPALNPEQRRAALGQFERANEVIAQGNREYGVHLLRNCCKLDPGNLVYRKTLRRLVGADSAARHWSPWSWIRRWMTRAKLKAAKKSGRHEKVLDYGEELLAGRPDDLTTPVDMADAADRLGHLAVAIWLLEQAWRKDRHTPRLNRALARLYEKRGNYKQAAVLWKLILKADPNDLEAHHKIKSLAAKETIVRGQYEDAVKEMG